MTTQYGAPLTGAQMKLLRAAGLGGRYKAVTCTSAIMGPVSAADFSIRAEFYLPAGHPAYKLLEAGWLDGRNVALWFGGDKAPDDWDVGPVLFRDGGEQAYMGVGACWAYDERDHNTIIAYTRKAEGMTTHADRVLADAERMARRMGGKFVKNELWNDLEAVSNGNGWDAEAAMRYAAPPQSETVTIAKMTEADSREWCRANFGGNVPDCWEVLNALNLIKPESTRKERFWASQPNGGGHVTDDVKVWVRGALEFE